MKAITIARGTRLPSASIVRLILFSRNLASGLEQGVRIVGSCLWRPCYGGYGDMSYGESVFTWACSRWHPQGLFPKPNPPWSVRWMLRLWHLGQLISMPL